eukprot:TRINITY_DN18738_c0_g1_i1.p1 TRINITY_DN18738_c0_g1~~TRINITY_DN18738_c0_g1_i1.p1  ORF type:complete len:478 (+),score=31.37 TRINITY_DN18738_c0_g1_i1:29-1462(+)
MVRALACGGNRTLSLLGVAFALLYVAIVYFEQGNEGRPVAEIDKLERYAAASVPNYKRIWYARSLLYMTSTTRGGEFNTFAHHLFWEKLLSNTSTNEAIPIERAVRPWSEVCPLDSDDDGFSNGQELGDPCCIWKPGKATAWSFHLSHPGRKVGTYYGRLSLPHNTLPNSEAEALIRKTDCETVRLAGQYEPSEDDFFAWYYREHFEDIEYGWKIPVRILILMAHVSVVMFWVITKELWRELLPAAMVKSQTTHIPRHLTGGRLLCVAVCAYLFADLLSAFVHAFLDNCYQMHPIVGPLCKAFQFHHYHPRSLTVAPVLYWVTHTLEGVTPWTLAYVLLGVYYQLPREIEVFVGCISVFMPLTYVWHNMSHLPDDARPWWFQALQVTGLALSSEAHFVHHRQIDTSWSSMAGIMDFVPNFLVRYFYDRQDSITTLNIICILAGGPWYVGYVYYVILQRGTRIQKVLVGKKEPLHLDL